MLWYSTPAPHFFQLCPTIWWMMGSKNGLFCTLHEKLKNMKWICDDSYIFKHDGGWTEAIGKVQYALNATSSDVGIFHISLSKVNAINSEICLNSEYENAYFQWPWPLFIFFSDAQWKRHHFPLFWCLHCHQINRRRRHSDKRLPKLCQMSCICKTIEYLYKKGERIRGKLFNRKQILLAWCKIGLNPLFYGL